MGQVVKLIELEDGIVQIVMEDRSAKNTFSRELIAGITAAFREIEANTNCKVVILTGYENYFCCGGTKDELFAIYKGEIGFNDLDFFTLPLDCKIPVISAMQGHAIGGGLVFGLYADFIILGKENIYTANFMKYGFTPGMGGTFLIPLKMGAVIGNEMLYTAENYRGGELMERNIPLKVVPKANVLQEALQMARLLAEKPRICLTTLKKHLTADIRSKLPSVIDAELQMHSITFHQPEVAERIEAFFGQ
jgi:polyketide biosynthesis enoyl-CoA hydratase PksI